MGASQAQLRLRFEMSRPTELANAWGTWVFLGMAAVVALSAGSWQRAHLKPASCDSRVPDEAVLYLRRVAPTAADRAAVRLAAIEYEGLERLAAANAANLQAGRHLDRQSPQIAEALASIERLRNGHAWSATSPGVTRALLVLADTNRHRLDLLLHTGASGFDAAAYACLSKSIDRLWDRVVARTASSAPEMNRVGLGEEQEVGGRR
jgi:hypothetical protein